MSVAKTKGKTPDNDRKMRRTGALRFALSPYVSIQVPKLQEQWKYIDTGEKIWLDVPSVMVDEWRERRGKS